MNVAKAFKTERKLKEQIEILDQTQAVTDEEFAAALHLRESLSAQIQPFIKEQKMLLVMSVGSIVATVVLMWPAMSVLFTTQVGLIALGIALVLMSVSLLLSNALVRKLKNEIKAAYLAVQFAEDDEITAIVKEDIRFYLDKKQASSILLMGLLIISVMILVMAPMFIKYASML